MLGHILILLSVPQLLSTFILSMVKPNGDADLNSIITHVTALEQKMEDNIARLQIFLESEFETQFQALKADLATKEHKISSLESRLKAAETDIAVLYYDLQSRPGLSEISTIKAQLESLKAGPIFQDAKIDGQSHMPSEKTPDNKDITSNMDRISRLETQVIAINKDGFDALNADLVSSVVKMNHTMKMVTTVQEEVEKARSNIQNLEVEVLSLENTVSQHSPNAASDRTNVSARTNDVAFQVSLTKMGSGWTTLIFDAVDFSTGGGYNATTGIFTATVSGTYLFWANIVMMEELAGLVYIYKGSERQAGGYAYGQTGGLFHTASAMAVTSLNEGDKVHFAVSKTTTRIFTGRSKISHYGGTLLHAR